MATDLDRGRSICRFMDEIAVSKTAPAELVDRLELMALMADWLDPLAKAPWPEVDGLGHESARQSLVKRASCLKKESRAGLGADR
jgi:hypothetical protein